MRGPHPQNHVKLQLCGHVTNQNILSSLSQERKPINVAVWWHTTCHVTPRSHRLVTTILFADNVALFNIKHNVYRNSCFPSTIIDWNNLDSNLRNSENVGIFKSSILKLINNCCSLKGMRLMTRLRLEFSHLREHRFKDNPAVGSVHLFHF